MAEKVLFQTKLVDLATSDLEGLGMIRNENNKKYRWVKNASAYTALVAGGSCLAYNLYPATASELVKRVHTPLTASALTCFYTVPAGVPVTAIGASGATTGDYGWILVDGVEAVTVYGGLTAVTPGQMMIATSVGGWTPIPQALAPLTGVAMPVIGARNITAVSSVGPTTAQTCIVKVMCI